MADIAITEKQVQAFLTGIENDLTQFMPAGFNQARIRSFMQDAALCILQSDDLKKALLTDPGKLSLTQALRTGAKSGLSLNPQEGKAALVAFKDKVTFMPMKNGYVEKLMETGAVEQVVVESVRSNDVFELEKTAKGDNYRFIPARKDRGAVDGYFACILSKRGVATVKWMTVQEVELWRDSNVPKGTLYHAADDKYNTPPAYRKGDRKENSFWWKNPDGGGQKTVLKQAIGALKLPSLDSLAALDEETWVHDDTADPAAGGGTGAQGLADALGGKLEPDDQPDPPRAEGSPVVTEPATKTEPATAAAKPAPRNDLF